MGPGGDLGDHPLDELSLLPVDPGEPLGIELGVPVVPVGLPRPADLLRRAGVVALAVRSEAVRGELDDQRGRLGPHGVDQRGEGLPDLADVGGRDVVVADAEGRRPGGDRAGHLRGRGGRLGDAVVLDHDEQRHPPEGGHVQRFVDGALAPGAVSDVGAGQRSRAGQFQAHPGGHGQALALHAGGQETPVVDVLAAADAAAQGALPPHDLGEQSVRVGMAGEEVAVPPVVAEHEVVVAEQGRDRDRNVLLPEAGMGGAAQHALLEQAEQGAFEVPDEEE
ncbi:hypothetical protein GCM10027612_55200 [Microbispora bryophytorum subsp. camponoti]